MPVTLSYPSIPSLLEIATECRKLRDAQNWNEISRLASTNVLSTETFTTAAPTTQWQLLEEFGLAAYYLGRIDEARNYFLMVEGYDLSAVDRERTMKNLEFADGPRFSNSWFDGNIPYWTLELVSFRGKPNLRFLEIGCFEGRATRWMLKTILTHPSSTIEVIDTFLGSVEHKHHDEKTLDAISHLRESFEHNIREFADHVTIHQGTSHAVLPQLAPDRQAVYDFIYVDGSHRQDDVYKDAVLCWPLLKQGGILAFDDYTWRFDDPVTGEIHLPSIGIDKFLSEHIGEFTLLFKEWQLHVRKEV